MTSASLPTGLSDTAEFLAQHERKDLLRFITCGSVDDGKSTLIGRLLLETGAVYEDQLAALQQDSAKHGTTEQALDPALLMDGLEDERQQGITIDVAYRYFQTPTRKFIIADSPGHEQYTRNMVTAASTAQLAIILVDARKGMLAQTPRHSFIASLLGVRKLVVAVNKMDLVDYSQTVFERIREDFRTFAGQLKVSDIDYLPLSGLRGDNISSRSDMIVHPDRLPQVGKHFDATLVWMSLQPLMPNKSYWIKQATRHTSAEVTGVAHRIDVNTLNCVEASSLKLNEIGYCRLALHDPTTFDAYSRNRRTGSFVLVDRVTHETVAAGMIVESLVGAQHDGHWNLELRSRQLQFTPSRIPVDQRRARYGHAAVTILLSGLSGSGKTTIAFALEERLFAAGHSVTVLDGQNLRHGISRDLGFSADERSENLRRAAAICRLVNDSGMIAIAAFVAPDSAIRDKTRQVVGEDRLLHVHLSAPLEVCSRRDISGRYQAAQRGEIVNFPGITAAYVLPKDADLVIPTDQWSIEQCVETIEQWLLPRLVLPAANSKDVPE
jgi:adenylyl-sulfate kinase